MLCFLLINTVLLNLLCVWILKTMMFAIRSPSVRVAVQEWSAQGDTVSEPGHQHRCVRPAAGSCSAAALFPFAGGGEVESVVCGLRHVHVLQLPRCAGW